MGERMTDLQIWAGPNGVSIPASLDKASDMVKFANGLSERQKAQIARAFEAQAYDMAAEYAWKRAMGKLKDTIAELGMKFIGEMLGRDDYDDATPIHAVITDYTAIELAEQLGIIGTTAALRLRQNNELITHFFSKDAEEELDVSTAASIVRCSIQYVLSEQHTQVAVGFSQFRHRLLGESLRLDDPQVEQIISSPLFYLRTILTILLYSIRNDIGARLEHSIANLNVLLPAIWKKLAETDKWHIGTAYRDTTAAGNRTASSGLKNALLKVNGFDYVPENLRSTTFIAAARQLLEVHFSFNNFYNEPAAVTKLSNLGTTIPSPALSDCMKAYLAVYLGNSFGVSRGAAPVAEHELSKVSRERWEYYFSKIIHNDEVVLGKNNPLQIERFADFLERNFLDDLTGLPRGNQVLYTAIVNKDYAKATHVSKGMIARIRTGKS